MVWVWFVAEDHFEYAYYTSGLDFASLSSHAEYFGTADAWKRYIDAPDLFHIGTLIKDSGSMGHHQDLDPLNAVRLKDGCDGNSGLQAVFAPLKTRQDIWNGMWQRHTYGTTGAGIVLSFSLKEGIMGDVVRLKRGETPSFRGYVGGTANLREVTIRKWDGSQWKDYSLPIEGGSIANIDFSDDEGESNAAYYLEVVQEDDERAVSSLIWVERSGMEA